jgi:hypothetical protein
MKYTRMLCWIRPHEKTLLLEEIKLQNKDIPVVFVDSLRKFKKNITTDSALILSWAWAEKKSGMKKLQKLLRAFSQHWFAFYTLGAEETITSFEGILMIGEDNVFRHCDPDGLIKFFEGVSKEDSLKDVI